MAKAAKKPAKKTTRKASTRKVSTRKAGGSDLQFETV